jgi:hypothetical protein
MASSLFSVYAIFPHLSLERIYLVWLFAQCRSPFSLKFSILYMVHMLSFSLSCGEARARLESFRTLVSWFSAWEVPDIRVCIPQLSVSSFLLSQEDIEKLALNAI